jgi:glycosyltransferase involved in cell wall biosynthesis
VNTPAVSIVVATYNYAHFLPHALDSILAQTISDWEVIIVDDGSTDGTAEVVRPYLEDSRFRYHCTSHVGQPATKNLGVRAAQGRYIAFLDADDVWHSEKLARQLPLLEANWSVGVVYSRTQSIDAVGRVIGVDTRQMHRGVVLQAMCLDNFVSFSSTIVRREVFDAVGLFDESIPLAIDYDLWLRAALHCEFDYVDALLVQYRRGHANLSCRGEERLQIVVGILHRFFGPNCGVAIPAALANRALSETYCSLGLVQRNRCRRSALASYCQALRYAPLAFGPWKGLAALALSESARRVVRRALRRPAEWQHIAPDAACEEPVAQA